jgi:hypothetical protein
MSNFIKINPNWWGYAALFFVVGLFFAPQVQAASLYVSPSGGSYEVGSTFQVGIFVSSADQPMNTAQAVISFDPDKLEVQAVNTKNSIFNLMVENPTFTNNTGNINFSGIVLNPGYTGGSGRLINISFRAKKIGKATVAIVGGQVLANDGEGSSILGSRGSGSYNIIEKKVIVKPVEQPTVQKPVITAPVTTTPTTHHADYHAHYCRDNYGQYHYFNCLQHQRPTQKFSAFKWR